MTSMNPTVAAVTERIASRSAVKRSAYLVRIESEQIRRAHV